MIIVPRQMYILRKRLSMCMWDYIFGPEPRARHHIRESVTQFPRDKLGKIPGYKFQAVIQDRKRFMTRPVVYMLATKIIFDSIFNYTRATLYIRVLFSL